jgi:hypothetical protein
MNWKVRCGHEVAAPVETRKRCCHEFFLLFLLGTLAQEEATALQKQQRHPMTTK